MGLAIDRFETSDMFYKCHLHIKCLHRENSAVALFVVDLVLLCHVECGPGILDWEESVFRWRSSFPKMGVASNFIIIIIIVIIFPTLKFFYLFKKILVKVSLST